MKRKISVFLIAAVLIFSFASCKNSSDTDSAVSSSDNSAATMAEENTLKTDSTHKNDKTKIVFNADKAADLGKFDSDIYGTLNVFLQDGYFLIYDEESKRQFTVFAEGYNPSMADGEKELIGEDMNFDGHTDFRVLFHKDSFNSYYYCFLWNNQAETFDHFQALSSLASPEFDKTTKTIRSDEKLVTGETTEVVYQWKNNSLSAISNKTTPAENDGNDNTKKEDSDIVPQYTYKDGREIAEITLNTNAGSECVWLVKIDNEEVIYVSEKTFGNDLLTQTISFTSAGPGQTTITLRYAETWEDDFSAEFFVNASVDENGIITLKMPQI